MNCEETKQLLHAYVDKELDASNARAIEIHLSQCKSCEQELQFLKEINSSVREHAPYYTAPDALRNSILDIIQAPASQPTKRHRNFRYRTALLLTSIAATFFLAISGISHYQENLREEQLIHDILGGHVRAVSSNRLSDISISNIRNVRPWLLRNLDYAPKVLDMHKSGYKLVGVRLDYFQQRKVAALAYQHQDHVINLYTWPSPDVADNPVERHQEKGYNLVYWCQNYMNYWLISDMETDQLKQFASYYREKLASKQQN